VPDKVVGMQDEVDQSIRAAIRQHRIAIGVHVIGAAITGIVGAFCVYVAIGLSLTNHPFMMLAMGAWVLVRFHPSGQALDDSND
jgi:hypothetical protein